MSNVVSIHPYFKIHPGKMDEFLDLCEKFAEVTSTESGCLWYDFTKSGDIIHCREAYNGAEGLLAHAENVNSIIGDALSISDLIRLDDIRWKVVSMQYPLLICALRRFA